ncbi:MAG: porin [Azospirillum sp.]|nr:porin [Azospirillum sp.]
MKKTLYGTTAIVALGLAIVAAAPASAQAPAQGFSSTNFQFTVGGLARGFVGGVSQTQIGAATAANNAAPAVAAGGNLQSFDIQRDYRLDLTARSTLPNGMVASAVVQIQPNSGPYTGAGGTAGAGIESQFRRNWVALQSAFGEVRIGALDNAAMQMTQRSMDAFTAGSTTNAGKALNDYTVRPNVFGTDDAIGATNMRMYDRSADKIAYFTPRIEGFQLGANYTPEASKDRNSGLATGTGGVLQRGYAFAGNYVNTFGGLGVRASAGYVQWKNPRNNVTGGADGSDLSVWGLGGGVTYMGFDFGGSYAQYDNMMSQPGANPLRLDAAGTAGATGVARFMADIRVFELGLGYTMGPARMSINYMNGESGTVKNANTTTAVTALTNAGKDKLHTYSVSGAYTMGPGVNLEATVFHVRATGPFTSVNVQNVQKATGLLTGLILTF